MESVGPGCEHFNRLFPRLRKWYIWINVWKLWIQNTFSKRFLTSDTFSNHAYDVCKFIKSDVNIIITLTPQLQTFELSGYTDPPIWENINRNLKNLKSIEMFYNPLKVPLTGTSFLFNTVGICHVYTFRSGSLTTKAIDVFSLKCLKCFQQSKNL